MARTDWDFYYHLIDAEGFDPDTAYECATDTRDERNDWYYDEGGEDAYCGYDCDGYAIGG